MAPFRNLDNSSSSPWSLSYGRNISRSHPNLVHSPNGLTIQLGIHIWIRIQIGIPTWVWYSTWNSNSNGDKFGRVYSYHNKCTTFRFCAMISTGAVKLRRQCTTNWLWFHILYKRLHKYLPLLGWHLLKLTLCNQFFHVKHKHTARRYLLIKHWIPVYLFEFHQMLLSCVQRWRVFQGNAQ